MRVPTAAASPDLDSTAEAFAARSTYELRKAKLLFQSFNSALLVAVGPKLVGAMLKLRLPVRGVIKHTIFDLFCGGRTLADCESRVASLARFGVKSILDYSVEGLGREADFDRTAAEVGRVIAQAAGDGRQPFAVFKVTGIARLELLERVSSGAALTGAERQEWSRVEARFNTLCRAAKAKGLRVLIDAEDSWIQPALDALSLAMMRELNRDHAVVFNTIQMYRVDRLTYLKDLHKTAKAEGFHVGAKLVRGAYMEKERERAASLKYPSPIQATKADTDRDFDAAVAFCLENLDAVELFAGTHNEASTAAMVAVMERRGIAPGDPRVTSAQLLSMGDHLTFNLAHAGYNAAKYVPYGPIEAVMPYLFRRVEENSSIKGQATRELQLIERELTRRAKLSCAPAPSTDAHLGSRGDGKTSRGSTAGR